MSSSAAASWKPYWVGTKNGLVYTWLSNQNCHFGVFGKFPAAAAVALEPLLALLPDDPHAASSADAAPVALTRPAPVSSFRRDGPSFIFSVWIASSTFGSTFLITNLHFLGAGCAPRQQALAGTCHAQTDFA